MPIVLSLQCESCRVEWTQAAAWLCLWHPPFFSFQGMKVSCTHFQCAAGAFAYLREHFPHAYSVDMSRQILTLNVNLMLVRSCLCWANLNPGEGADGAGSQRSCADGSEGQAGASAKQVDLLSPGWMD